MKKIWNYMEGINGIILSLYICCISIAYAFIKKSWIMNSFYKSLPIIILSSFIISPLLIKIFKKIKIQCYERKEKYDIIWKITFYVIPFIFLLVHYIGYYPGGFTSDAFDQYNQAVTNQYSDWHPVLQTLFAIKLPLTLTNGWKGSIILFQVVLMSIAIGYAINTLFQYTNKKYTIGALLFIVLNPHIRNLVCCSWKDSTFAIFSLILMTFALKVFFTDGKWFQSKKNCIWFVIIISATTLFRHNAILFTFMCFIAMIRYIPKKSRLWIIASIILLVMFIKLPVFYILKVQKPGSRQVETLGLPMSIIGAVVRYDSEALDDETKEFAYKLSPKEAWELSYSYNGFNGVKWNKKTDKSIVEEYGTTKVISMMLNCFKNSPREAFMGLISLTECVYTIYDDYDYTEYPHIGKNDYGFQSKGIQAYQEWNTNYTKFCNKYLPHLFQYIGAMHLIMIIAILSKCQLNHKKEWGKILFAIPVFTYNFGTMLLLTGAADSYRFFYYTFLVTPIVLAFLCSNKREESLGGEKK